MSRWLLAFTTALLFVACGGNPPVEDPDPAAPTETEPTEASQPAPALPAIECAADDEECRLNATEGESLAGLAGGEAAADVEAKLGAPASKADPEF